MKTRVLYIGNQLKNSGKSLTTIDTLVPLLQSEGYTFRCASHFSNKLKRLIHMLVTVFRNRDWAQCVLIDTYSTSNFWYAILVARLCRFFSMDYIPILHGGNLPNRLSSNPKVFNHYLKYAYAVVSPSDYLKHAFAKAGFHQIQVIPNSIELENYHFKERNKVAPKLLWVRAFDSTYNPQMAIETLRLLTARFPSAKLTMVGGDKDGSMADCKRLVEQHDLPVVFTGLQPKKEWIALAKDHDIFINTSSFDNLPVSVLEAMALGLPVISTQVGGIPFMIEPAVNGLLVNDRDATGMQQAVESLIDDPILVSRITQNAYNYIQHYDWKFVKNKWKALLSN